MVVAEGGTAIFTISLSNASSQPVSVAVATADGSAIAGGVVFGENDYSATGGTFVIPAGETTSYGALAKRLGEPGASRAVGLANGSNPVAIVIPCHRVIGADGSLTGYASGVEIKRSLLELEGALAPALPLLERPIVA